LLTIAFGNITIPQLMVFHRVAPEHLAFMRV